MEQVYTHVSLLQNDNFTESNIYKYIFLQLRSLTLNLYP